MAEPNRDPEHKRALAAALLKCPSMADRAGRDAIIRQLPPDLQPRIPRADKPLLDVTNILDTVLIYADGLARLIEAVRYFEGKSEPMAAVDALLAEWKSSIQATPRAAAGLGPQSARAPRSWGSPWTVWLITTVVVTIVLVIVTAIVMVIRQSVDNTGSSPTAPREAVAPATLPPELQAASPTKTLPDATALSTETAVPTPTATITPTPQAGATAAGPNEMALIYVPAGPFWMGASDEDHDAQADERPQHQVYVEGFWMSRTEVTNAQYLRCVAAGTCSPPGRADFSKDYDRLDFPTWPVTDVTWHDANAYAEWVGGRLPTEAEWEKACRGEDGRIYPWGNSAPTGELLNYNRVVYSDPVEVGTFPSGVYGLFDMAGNVAEWTASLDWPYPYQPEDGRNSPEAEGARISRGGTWSSYPYAIRCSYRARDLPGVSYLSLGFRVVLPAFASSN